MYEMEVASHCFDMKVAENEAVLRLREQFLSDVPEASSLHLRGVRAWSAGVESAFVAWRACVGTLMTIVEWKAAVRS